MGDDEAGAYAAAVVAAKLVVWVAIGVGLYLLPEATRRRGAGRGPAAGAPARARRPRGRRGADAARLRRRARRCCCGSRSARSTRPAADALVVLGVGDDAAGRRLPGVQYMLALREMRVPVGARRRRGRRAVPALGRRALELVGFATVVLALQARRGAAVLALGARAADRAARAAADGVSRAPAASRAGSPTRRPSACARARPRAGGGHDRRDRLVPRALDDRARARGRADGARSSRSTRTRARTAARRRSAPTASRGDADHAAFRANLARRGRGRARAPRARAERRTRSATSTGPLALLYVDGAHRFGPARDDIARWGARVAPGGTMLVHDAFSSIGVTRRAAGRVRRARRLALRRAARARWPSTSGSPRRCAAASARRDAARQLAQLPWFARNVLFKVLVLARLRPVAHRLGLPGRDALAVLAREVARDAVAGVDRAGDGRVAGRERDRLGARPRPCRSRCGSTPSRRPAGV